MSCNPHTSPIAARTINVLAYPSVQLIDVTGPLQVFASANDLAVDAGNDPPYVLQVVSPNGQAIMTSAGLEIGTSPLPMAHAALDTLIVAVGQGVHAAAANPELVDWIAKKAGRARRIASVCTGAFLLASTGLLNGRRATTHWSYCDELARQFSDIHVERDPIFVSDDRIWTSAGVMAGIDLALALVEEDLGRAAALAVARYIVVFLKRPGGQAQFSETLALQKAEDKFGVLYEWIRRNLADDLSLPALAGHAAMSERSFSRHFVKATGITPARAVERLRMEEARRLLSETSLPVKRIARQCGFGSEETMRRSFTRLLAVKPHEYRARFSP